MDDCPPSLMLTNLFRSLALFGLLAAATLPSLAADAESDVKLNDRYRIEWLAFSNGSFALSPFRITATGRVQGVAHLRSPGIHKRIPIRGEVTSITQNGPVTVATIEGRAGSATFAFTFNNSSGQPDLFRGDGTLRFQGRTIRVKIDNRSGLARPVRVK